MNQYEIQTAALSNRKCWQIARNTLRVDPRCAQKEKLREYIDKLYAAMESVGDAYRERPDSLDDNSHHWYGVLLAVATPMLTTSYLLGYRQAAAAIGQAVPETAVQAVSSEAQGRAGLMASILLQTTRERAPELSGDRDEDQELIDAFRDGYTFSEQRATAATTYEMVRGYKSMVERALRASGQSWGKWWEVSDAHDQQDECDDNVDAGIIPIGQEFPSGDQQEPAHPYCGCSVFYTRMDQ